MKILVCGSRDFDDKLYFDMFLDGALKKIKETKNVTDDFTIISGMARGADTLAVKYAQSRGLTLQEHPADWDTYGNTAGFKRNMEMVKDADVTIAFYKGAETSGTKHTVRLSKKKGIPIIALLDRKVVFSVGFKKEANSDE